MIKINIKNDNDIIEIVKVSGHALYDEAGKDIVCASVSSIITTTINAIITFNKNAITYENKEGFIKIDNNSKDNITNNLLNNMVRMLSELESDYPKNINMKRGI